MTRNIYYFRNDFRLADNPLLNNALECSDQILFLCSLPKKSWGKWRKKFYLESISALSIELKERGHHLWPLKIEDIPVFLQELTPDSIYTPYIPAHDEELECEKLRSIAKVETGYNDRLLFSPPTKIPDVFTQFRKSIESNYSPSTKTSIQTLWPKPLTTESPSNFSIQALEFNPNSAFPFEGGEDNGQKRLKEYLYESHSIQTYKETRNGLVGLDYSTKFSPYLALGCVSATAIYREVECYEREVLSNESTYWVKFELWWREYFRWVYHKYGKRFFYHSGIKNRIIESNYDESTFNKWSMGKTSDSFVNANMIELNETGWMSNRGRQNVASYLVKDLKQPWWLGANYFEKHLIDYDVYSNWGNWQYVAGVGNDPRPNRYFDTKKQASIYDGDGTFRYLWLKDVNPNG